MILIVDDSQENIFSLKALLTLHSFEVDTASSGEEALRKILTNSYALIILDVQMPEMDGFEVAETISGYSKSRDIPIIFLSAINTHKKFVARGYTSGGIDYVTKPVDPDILLLKIKTFYRLSEQTRQLIDMEKVLREEIELRKKAETILEEKVKERTKELVKSNQRLEESNNELQQFAFIASHDLQEPLRKIQTFSGLALDKFHENEEQVKPYLGKILESATRLRNLVTDLLQYSKIYTDDEFTTIDLNVMISEILSDLELQIETKHCEFEIGKLPRIEAIPFQIRQVFQNLLSNSIKFSREGQNCQIKITGELIATRSFDAPPAPNGRYCRIMVCDNGIGFSNEFRSRIFEIFQRLRNRDAYEGTGIGLAIVKKVVERHDGIIDATGKENEGAKFTIVVPVAHPKPDGIKY
ncbi:MAG TPA: response regulator [Cyclobacteriaceae bacterium]|nr:response regulator [Cyclobacteriaceae bacterium]